MLIDEFSSTDIRTLGRRLTYDYPQRFPTLESAAQECVQMMRSMLGMEHDEPAFALIRIFLATRTANLPDALQARVTGSAERALVLVGTAGLEADWNHRERSSRRVISIGSGMSPMFKGVFRDLNITWDETVVEDIPKGIDAGIAMTRYFYVPDAGLSSYITDQEQFVEPYGIRSVLAVGSQFLSGDAYVMIGFARMRLADKQVETLTAITPYISTMLAVYDGSRRIWD